MCLTSDAGEVMRLKYVIQYTGSVFLMEPVGTCCAQAHSEGTFTLTPICSDNATLCYSFSVRVGDLSDKSDRDHWRFKKIEFNILEICSDVATVSGSSNSEAHVIRYLGLAQIMFFFLANVICIHTI